MPGESSDTFDINAAAAEIGADLGFDTSDSPESGERDDLSGAGAGDAGGDENLGGGSASPAPSPAPSSEAAAAPATGAPTSPAPPPVDINIAPKTWRKEAAEQWAQLPEHIRAEVHKREQDMYAGLEQYKGAATFGNEIDQICRPYKQVMDHFGVTPQQVIPGLLNAHATLTIGNEEAKINTLANLVQSYNIPLPALLSKLLGVDAASLAPAEDPSVKPLRDELGQVKSQLTAIQQRDYEQRRQQIASEISEFASKPENMYFEELADDIAQLISSKVCTDLKSAYEKALWANPVVRAKEMQRLDAERSQKLEKERQERLKRAGRANATSSQAAPKPGSPTAPKGSLDQTLEAAYADIMSRS